VITKIKTPLGGCCKDDPCGACIPLREELHRIVGRSVRVGDTICDDPSCIACEKVQKRRAELGRSTVKLDISADKPIVATFTATPWPGTIPFMTITTDPTK